MWGEKVGRKKCDGGSRPKEMEEDVGQRQRWGER